MSAENVEMARSFYSEEQRIDLVPLMSRDDAAEQLEARFGDLFQPDFETVPGTGMVTAERGMTGFVNGFREWNSSFESWAVLADEFIPNGNRVLVLLDIIARTKTDEVEMPQRAANVLTFEDGRIARLELHLDVGEARRAAGLSG